MALPTLMDLATRLDPNGKISAVAELLSQNNEILLDMAWQEGNLPTGHRTTTRVGLPQAAWRMLNYGVQPSRSVTSQITDACGMLEAYAEVDKSLADLNGNTADFRMSEDRAFLESMNITMSQTLFYGDTTVTPEKFVGLSPRYSSLAAPSGQNIVDAGGTTNGKQTSIWVLVWGENSVFGIYPKGSKAGLQSRDLGEVTLIDTNQGKFQGYRTHYKWDCGLSVRDWRLCSRVANIDVPTISAMGTAGNTSDLSILKNIALAIERIPNLNLGRPVIYVNRLIAAYLRLALMSRNNVYVTSREWMGQPDTLMFMGIPVRKVDNATLLLTESVVA